MSVKQNAQDLFEFIAEVYSIDLPVIRDVLGYGDGRWWQAELVPSRFCKIKSFDDESDTQPNLEETSGAWLSVLKSSCDPPPPLPEALLDWVQLSPNPSKRPSPRPKISKRHQFKEVGSVMGIVLFCVGERKEREGQGYVSNDSISHG